MLASVQMPAWAYVHSLTETSCTAFGCSTAPPSNSMLSNPIIQYSTMYNGALGGGGGGGGDGSSRKRCQLSCDNQTRGDHAIIA